VRFMDPAAPPAAAYRFHSQKDLIVRLTAANSGKPNFFRESSVAPEAQSEIVMWGLRTVRTVQDFFFAGSDDHEVRAQSVLAKFFRFISFLAEEPFYFILFAWVWLPSHGGRGPRMTFLFLLNMLVNQLLKVGFHQPRPFELDPTLQLASAVGFGFPSGHSQSALFFWGLLALEFPKIHTWAAAALIIPAVGLSRVLLGVHFPQDVFGGWAVGAGLLLGWALLQRQLKPLLNGSLVLWWVIALWLLVPALWFNANPDVVAISSLTLGLLGGLSFFHGKYKARATERSPQQSLAFYAITVIGLFAIAAVGQIAVGFAEAFGAALTVHVLRYILLGLWISSVRRIL